MATITRCPYCNAMFGGPAEQRQHVRQEHVEEERRRVDELIDEESRESFPASDAPSSTPIQRVGQAYCPETPASESD